MIKVTAVKPHERMEKIRRNLRERNEAFKNDPYAKAFGISVQDNLSEISGRVLDAPKLEYQGKLSSKSVDFTDFFAQKYFVDFRKAKSFSARWEMEIGPPKVYRL